MIFAGDLDAVPFFLLFHQGEEQSQQGGEILLDIGHDHVPHLRPGTDAMDLVVIGAEGDSDLCACVV